ncbi:unnamed protein product [Ambrosiozyma monospora]|uniref:Unnamed protein product n=1 Tax=Ambrosiozyma monospora TaxID=43982 RepID=A0ACB5U2M6_AMBMO|nr:unnamed protein product [Ambrosiozyma monospora]
MNSSSSSSSSPNHHPQPQLRSQSPYQPQSTSFDKPNVFSTLMNQRISNFTMPFAGSGSGSVPGTTSIENLINATNSVTGGSDIGTGAGINGLRTGPLGVGNPVNGVNTHTNGSGVGIPVGGASNGPVNSSGPGSIPGFGSIAGGYGGAASGFGIGNGGAENFPFHIALNDEFWSDLFVGNDKTIIDYDMSVFMNDPAAEIL